MSVVGLVRVKFDASGYFEQAIDREIVELAYGGWHGAAAIAVAEFCAASSELPQLKAALEQVRSLGAQDLLIELHGPDALRWLREHRMDVVGLLESVFGRGSCDPEALDGGPYWDDDPDWHSAYERRQEPGEFSHPS